MFGNVLAGWLEKQFFMQKLLLKPPCKYIYGLKLKQIVILLL